MPNDISLKPTQSLERLTILNEVGHLAIASTDRNKLFHDAAELLRQRLDLQHVMIGTIDYEKQEVETRATAGIQANLAAQQPGQGIQEGIIGEAIESGRTIVVNDVSQHARYLKVIPTTQSEMCIPLKVTGRVVGFLNIESDRPAAFEQADIELLEAVGSFLGQAIRNAELRQELEASRNDLESLVQNAGDAIITFDREGRIRTWNKTAELQQKLQIEQLLNEVSVELRSILMLDPLLDKIAQITRRFIDYELFAILLVDEDRQEFVWKTSVGYSEQSYFEVQRLSVHEGVVGRVVRTRAPILVNDVKLDPDYKPVRTRSGKDPQSELALPLIAKDRIVGVLVLESTEKAYFGPHHLRLLTPLAAQIAVSIENANLYQQKSRDVLTKQVMNEIGKEINAILELDELLNRLAVLIGRVIEYEILGIFLYRPESDDLEIKISIGYDAETVERSRIIPLGKGILGHAAQQRRTIVCADLAADPRAIFAKTLDGRVTRSEVAVPIVSRDRLLGGLVVESCDVGHFKPEQVQVLETLASQMAVSIENARLFQQVLAKEQKLEADFALARDLQASMLPVSMPELAGFEIAALYKPAESLGGDYYDFIWLGEGSLGLTIGDVSGKGVAAAMTMAATRSALRFAARVNSSPSQVLYHVNRRLYRDVKKRTFVSLFYGILDVKTRVYRWSNGGHHPPILLRPDGTREYLSKGGTVLALFDKSRYASAQTLLGPGDLLCFYTDGVIEARNRQEEEFGIRRLEDILLRKRDHSPKDILRVLTTEIRKFSRGTAQHDDITVFILRVREGA